MVTVSDRSGNYKVGGVAHNLECSNLSNSQCDVTLMPLMGYFIRVLTQLRDKMLRMFRCRSMLTLLPAIIVRILLSVTLNTHSSWPRWILASRTRSSYTSSRVWCAASRNKFWNKSSRCTQGIVAKQEDDDKFTGWNPERPKQISKWPGDVHGSCAGAAEMWIDNWTHGQWDGTVVR